MLCAFWKTLGMPLESMKTPVFGFGPISIEVPSSSKLVDQPSPAETEKGNPLVQRPRPLNPHPPNTAFMKPFDAPAPAFAVGKIPDQVEVELVGGVEIRRRTPQIGRPGIDRLICCKPTPPEASNPFTRSAFELASIDLEYT